MAKSKTKKRTPKIAGELNQRQERFVLEYASTGNGVQSARRAGYTGSYAVLAVTAHDLLKNPKVAKQLKDFGTEMKSEAIASRDERLAFLSRVVRGEEKHRGNPPAMKDRIRAADLMAKMSGDLAPQKVEIEAKSGVLEFVRKAEEAEKSAE